MEAALKSRSKGSLPDLKCVTDTSDIVTDVYTYEDSRKYEYLYLYEYISSKFEEDQGGWTVPCTEGQLRVNSCYMRCPGVMVYGGADELL